MTCTVSESGIVSVDFDVQVCRELYKDSQAAAIGGKSNVRSERGDTTLIDQLVGLAGNAAISVWRDGDLRSYRDQRHQQNRFPNTGDGGYDLPRCRLDVKTSMMRSMTDPLAYRLIVRPPERHKDWVYVLALVPVFELNDLADGLSVHLVGWINDNNLPSQPETSGPFAGAYVVLAKLLTPMPPLCYER